MTSTARDATPLAPERPSGEVPDPHLVSQLSDVTPGSALEVGCGGGADARWLARHGWRVEAVDASAAALHDAEERVRSGAPDLAAAISWRHADLVAEPPPAEQYDLVACRDVRRSAGERERLVRGLAAAVRRTGTLLLVGPGACGPQASGADDPDRLATASELAALLDDRWLVDVCACWPRTATGGDGEPVTVHDAVLRATRL